MALPVVRFGRTGWSVSRLGLGAGGPSRLGTRGSGDQSVFDSAVEVVRRAVDLGITLLDTAETYRTEPHVGAAIRDLPSSVRDKLVICTKHAAIHDAERPPRTGDEIVNAIEESLRALGVDAIDLEQVHGVEPREYDHVRTEIIPALDRARAAGKIRRIGLTEMFQRDTTHETLGRVLDDVALGAPIASIMVGHNLLNPSAREDVLPRAHELGVATLGMFAVRRAMSRPERLREVVAELARDPRFDERLINGTDGEPLSWLLDYAETLPEASYRYCLTAPSPDVILCGTGSIDHLEANVRAIERGPLPDEALARLRAAFGWVTSLTGH